MNGQYWLDRFRRRLDRLGVVCVSDDDVRRHLESNGAEAAYWPASGPGQSGTLLLLPNPSAPAVLEEIAHLMQDVLNRFSGPETTLEETTTRREIEVAECLHDRADRLEMSQEERIQTMTNLAYWRGRLEVLERARW